MKKNIIFIFLFSLIEGAAALEKNIEELIKDKYIEAEKIKNSKEFNEILSYPVQNIDKKTEKEIKIKINESLDKGKKEFEEYRNEIDKAEGWEDLSSFSYYLFISSSIPKKTLYNYVEYSSLFNKLNQKNKIVFLLRGCVNSKGCSSIKGTVDFTKDLLTLGNTIKEGVPGIEIWIEPFMFKKFNVKRVPCLLNKKTEKIICGDYNLDYMIKQISK